MKIAINTPTKESFIEVCNYIHNIHNEIMWHEAKIYKHNLCVTKDYSYTNLTYCSRGWFVDEGYKIISANDYLDAPVLDLINVKPITNKIFRATFNNKTMLCISNSKSSALPSVIKCRGVVSDNKIYISNLED